MSIYQMFSLHPFTKRITHFFLLLKNTENIVSLTLEKHSIEDMIEILSKKIQDLQESKIKVSSR